MIQRKIGVLAHAFGAAIAVRDHGRADRRARHHDLPAAIGGMGKRAQDVLRTLLQIAQHGRRTEQHGKFVSADTEYALPSCCTGDAVSSTGQQTIACTMAERVVHDLQIVEIDQKQRPGARRRTVEGRKCGIEGGTVAEAGQGVGGRTALPVLHPLVTLDRDGAQMKAVAHDCLVNRGRTAWLAIVEGECPDRPSACVENRGRPAGAVTERQHQMAIAGPARVAGDIGDDNRLAQIGGRAARADVGADRDTVQHGRIGGRQAGRGEWVQPPFPVDQKDRACGVRRFLLHLQTQPCHGRIETLAGGDHLQDDVLKM